jgi:excisionase family DNA binding protein
MPKKLKPPPGSPITCSINEACRLLSVGKTTFYGLMKTEKIATTKIGGRRLAIVQSLYDYLNRKLNWQDD